ncbi:MAG: flagellar biosynthesis anti-sigma factor FlgM [Deltaproteobacteria bacterium]|nr:flagellar biosynthesis anti-sigma factor FlgM [Deltaproteobacteria bacterium]
MTVKKVNPGEDLQSDLVSILKARKSQKLDKTVAPEEVENSVSAEERIKIGLGKAINAELNAELLKSERRNKVENLKELIAAGKYNPSSADVAQAVGEELVFEILSKPQSAAAGFFEGEE